MEHYGKETNIYKGIWISFIVLISVPVFFYFFFYGVIGKTYDLPQETLVYTCLAFASVVSFLFNLICWVTGFLNGLVSSMVRRIYNLFANIKIFKGKAVRWYFESFVRNGGFILWGFIIFFIVSAIIGVIGFYHFFTWYNAIG